MRRESCQKLMRTLAEMPGVKLAGMCDVWDAGVEAARKIADPKALVTKSYHKLLARR